MNTSQENPPIEKILFINGIKAGDEEKSHLTVSDHFLIQGVLNGDINSTPNSKAIIAVGKQGLVRGNITGFIVLIEGMVEGDITATNLIELHSGGIVIGEVNSPELILEPGSISFRYRQKNKR
jgi:cytoskeletal protein CcmA (bactofilin family)